MESPILWKDRVEGLTKQVDGTKVFYLKRSVTLQKQKNCDGVIYSLDNDKENIKQFQIRMPHLQQEE